MMVKDRSENAFDTIRIRGKWWIPDGEAEPKKVSGALTFDVGSGGVLDLDEALSDNFRSIPVVHGLGTQGECVTIFNGGTASLSMNGNSVGFFRRETIAFYDMWVGNQLFHCKEEVRFKEYSFGIHNIENWADRHCFFPPRRQKQNRTSVSYKSPKPILLFQDECMTIHLDGFGTGPSYSLGQQEASIQHFPRIVIRSKDGVLPYYGQEGTPRANFQRNRERQTAGFRRRSGKIRRRVYASCKNETKSNKEQTWPQRHPGSPKRGRPSITA